MLAFYYNNTSVLRNSTFCFCPNLIELIISNNPLTTVDPAAFYGLRKLQRLTIADSMIGRLPSIFDDLVTLTEINLQNNSLTDNEENLLRKNINLDVIHLEYNQLINLPDVFLSVEKPLSELNFMQNQLSSISTMQAKAVNVDEGIIKALYITTNSEEINAYSNQIDTINCPDLQTNYFNLFNNSASYLKCIAQMPKLVSLMLQKNKLRK